MDTTTIEAGRELDARIAEQVMGWTYVKPRPDWDGAWWGCPPDSPGRPRIYAAALPHYSTDMTAAWQVVEAMSNDYTIRVMGMPGATAFCFWWPRANLWADTATTAAARICRAALAIHAGQLPAPD